MLQVGLIKGPGQRRCLTYSGERKVISLSYGGYDPQMAKVMFARDKARWPLYHLRLPVENVARRVRQPSQRIISGQSFGRKEVVVARVWISDRLARSV